MVDDVTSPPSPVQEGDVIGGKFRVERVLGIGGMGVVVAAMHLDLDQRVALKFLLPAAAHRPDVAARFGREARSAAKIRSEHVAKVLDVGTLADGAPYMVMEYMDGEDLERLLRRGGPLPVPLAITYVLQATEAIAEAHALGIVHRDLKPANLFLAQRPSGEPIIKVLDFGISKSTQATDQAHMTKTSAILGSPLYMSPEQMASAKSVDTRSDIWAIGVVLYELLTQRTPFPADTMPELVAAILQRVHEPLRQLRPDVPPGLEAALDRCLEKDPARRYQNVAEMAAAFAPFGPPRSEVSVERILHVVGGADLANSGRAPGFPQSGAMLAAPTAVGVRTNSQWSGSVSGVGSPPLPTTVKVILGGLALAVVVAGIAVAVIVSNRATTGAVVVSATAASANAGAGNAGAAATGALSASPSASSAPSAAEAAATASAPAATVVPRHTTPPKASAPPACKTISYFDEDGNKRFKQECPK